MKKLNSFLLLILIIIVFRIFLYEPFRIPSGSMMPNLVEGDFLFVSKFSHGYSKYSFPFDLIPFKGRIFGEQPKRGQVVIFMNPQNTDEPYIKRVVGIAGDYIKILSGRVYVNDQLLPRSKISDFSFNGFTAIQYKEKSFDKEYNIIETLGDSAVADNTPVYKVPKGYFFVLGDNRDNSYDSRYSNGISFIPEENMIGEAKIIIFSLEKIGGIRILPRFNRFFIKIV